MVEYSKHAQARLFAENVILADHPTWNEEGTYNLADCYVGLATHAEAMAHALGEHFFCGRVESGAPHNACPGCHALHAYRLSYPEAE